MQLTPNQPCTTCGNLVVCTCRASELHAHDCRWLRAMRLSIELACPHGYQACTICDPCDCGSEFPIENVR